MKGLIFQPLGNGLAPLVMNEEGKPNSLPKIIYIMGTARSGSTILEIMLANGSQIFGAGEMTALIQDGFLENRVCSCNQRFRDCDIWGNISRNLRADVDELHVLSLIQRKVDWHDGPFRQLLGLMPSDSIRRYKAVNEGLLASIQKVTGASAVVDSSKYAGRALALKNIVKADVFVLCLTRSPEGLMASFQKPNEDEQRPKKPLNALLYYMVALFSLRIASAFLGGRVQYIRYEDLLADPTSTLKKIASFCSVDLLGPCQHLTDQAPFLTGHLVTGNRLRKQNEIRFDANNAAPSPKGIGAKFAIVVMKGWQWLLRF